MEALFPRIGIEDLTAGKHQLLAFQLSGGEVEIHLAAEVGFDLAVGVHREEGFVETPNDLIETKLRAIKQIVEEIEERRAKER